MRKIIEDFCITTESTIKVFETTQYRITNVSKNGSKYNFDYNQVPDYKHYEFLETFGFRNSETNYIPLTEEILDVIEFVEILKAFSNNKLNTKKQYELSFFTAKIKNSEDSNSPILSIKLSNNSFITYDKTEAQILSAKLSKVISKCEVI